MPWAQGAGHLQFGEGIGYTSQTMAYVAVAEKAQGWYEG